MEKFDKHVCLILNAQQNPLCLNNLNSKSNNAETTIGQWSAWGTDSNKYSQMVFNNGLACWNGPQRSTLVRLTCGIESKVVAVSEPNRCEVKNCILND